MIHKTIISLTITIVILDNVAISIDLIKGVWYVTYSYIK